MKMESLIELEFGEPIEVLTRGTTNPLLCRLEEPSGTTSLWVVKLPSSKRPDAAPAEIAASRLLPAFGLSGVQIGVARLPDPELLDSFDATTDEGARLRAAIKTDTQRLCFASRFIDAVEHVDGAFRQRAAEDALRLFFFDAFIWHADRTRNTPNILWKAGNMVPIDHARAFHAIEAIDESGLSKFDYANCRSDQWSQHVALRYLRKQWKKGAISVGSCDIIATEVQFVGLSALQKLVTDWPEQLDSATFKDDLRRFIKARFALLPTLIQEISYALSR